MKATGTISTFRASVSPLGYNQEIKLRASSTLRTGWRFVDINSFRVFTNDPLGSISFSPVIVSCVPLGHLDANGIPIQEDIQLDVGDIRQIAWAKGFQGADFGAGACDTEFIITESVYLSRGIGDTSPLTTDTAECLLYLEEVQLTESEWVHTMAALVQSGMESRLGLHSHN